MKAARLDGSCVATPDGAADVVLPDGRPAWIDGGPRTPSELADAVVHSESVELGSLAVVPPPVAPVADLAADQLAAVDHRAGPARVIAPAGSGKTRVLTERLRHLHVDRGYEPSTVLAVAYNKQAQLEMEARTAAFRPRVRTLNSLGLWVLAEHRGGSPPVLDEPDVRRMIDALLPGRRQRRANTDPIGPYIEGLTAIRLGLTDPEVVEASRDDVPGLAELFPAYRHRLAERRAVDFDEQVYAAVEALLQDGPFRRSMQRSCRHLLVDEFQDLTPAHVLLLRLLAIPALDVFGVGDDDQCIYGYAGADPAFLIDYGQLFPGATPHPLQINYRCPTEVVAGARTLLGYNHRRVAKVIEPGPAADPTAGALRVIEHGAHDGATAVVELLREWLGEPGVEPSSIAVLTRVNSLLLAPHVALHEAGLPAASVLRPEVLERTGMRAALAYLRLATSPDGLAAGDVIEVLRRPTRGLPQWFPERLDRRTRWTLAQLAAIADQVPEKEAGKVLRLVDDLQVVVDAGRHGTTRDVLEAVRDDVGLGAAMSLLDRTGGGQGSSHLDDLDGLLGVADLHPEPAGFEAWLRAAFQRAADPAGITLSTIHRVKGREWDRVAVFGVADGLVPHRLAEDVEEERRVLHVAITRGRHRVALLADRTPAQRLPRRAGRHRTTDAGPATHHRAPSCRRAARRRPAAASADGIAATCGARHHRAGRSRGHGRGRRRPVGARPYVVGRAAAGALRRAGRARRPPEPRSSRRPSCGARPPTPRPRFAPGGRNGPAPTACRRTSSSTTSTCGASPWPARPRRPSSSRATASVPPSWSATATRSSPSSRRCHDRSVLANRPDRAGSHGQNLRRRG